MDHDVVVREKMTEKYLLEELDPKLKDEFEEHFFDCPECALDVRAGSEFVSGSKIVLAESPEPVLVPAAIPAPPPFNRGWFAWLRPAIAAPVFALLLAVIGYQNLVTYPQLRSALTQPQVLPWASVNVGTYGAEGPVISVAQGRGFLLFVRIPPDGNYTHCTADLYNPNGRLEWSLTIPAIPGQDQWPVQVPGARREAGTYKISVRGVTAAGESKDLGSTSFELQIQK
ncbi:MAG TPA: zf-HC2 domain-containing protein [Candidatus Eremiobacteraceae bacterium]|nr:zf-HC2 domain-containing protein [Candidatus Eremiobacteraceae bacterium]